MAPDAVPPRRPDGGDGTKADHKGGGRPRRSPKKPWQVLIAALGVLALLAVCGLSSYLIVDDERKGLNAPSDAAPAPTAVPRDITSRSLDPAPLTEAEVFPTPEIVIHPQEPPYKVLKTQAAKDCKIGASDGIGELLAGLGCSQVVRGTLASPTGDYLVTTGIFNLDDVAGAEGAHQQIKSLVDGRKGRFLGMVAGKGTDALALSSAQVGWHVRGHFLAYAVIAQAKGESIAEGDPYARQILFDMIELHLRGGVLEKRATMPMNGSAAPSAATQPPT